MLARTSHPTLMRCHSDAAFRPARDLTSACTTTPVWQRRAIRRSGLKAKSLWPDFLVGGFLRSITIEMSSRTRHCAEGSDESKAFLRRTWTKKALKVPQHL